ncbi:MAG: hypothetical protein HQ559_16230, partial [Lentisphaerae bacterium]|nr:hypothetical protein [Lentisphaerota bacterium]
RMNPTPSADIAQALSLSYFLFSVLLVAQLVQIAVAIWHRTRRRPPLDKELADLVHRDYCDEQRTIHDKKHDSIFSHFNKRIRDFASDVSKRFHDGDEQFKTIERSLGRIEGKLEAIRKNGHKS